MRERGMCTRESETGKSDIVALLAIQLKSTGLGTTASAATRGKKFWRGGRGVEAIWDRLCACG